jgi:hypothetical protein
MPLPELVEGNIIDELFSSGTSSMQYYTDTTVIPVFSGFSDGGVLLFYTIPRMWKTVF